MDPRECLEVADQALSNLDMKTAAFQLLNYEEFRRQGMMNPTDVASSGQNGDQFLESCARRLESLRDGYGRPPANRYSITFSVTLHGRSAGNRTYDVMADSVFEARRIAKVECLGAGYQVKSDVCSIYV